MDEDTRRQAHILLEQVSELRDHVQANLEAGRFQNDDIQMDRYNALASRAVSLFPDDPEIGEGKLVLMPDANLQSVGLFPGLASPGRASSRLKTRLEVIIARVQSLLGEYSPHDTPTAQGGTPTSPKREVELVLATVEALRAEGPQLPPLEIRSFDFTSDPDIRAILSEDYLEAQRAYAVDAFKAAGLLAGAVVEGMLLDALRRPGMATLDEYQRATRKLPRTKSGDINWDKVNLRGLTHVVRQLGILRDQAMTLLGSVKDLRDTIHPWNELTRGARVRHEEAYMLLGAVKLVYRDLDKARAAAGRAEQPPVASSERQASTAETTNDRQHLP